jgi:hypothetical protein
LKGARRRFGSGAAADHCRDVTNRPIPFGFIQPVHFMDERIETDGRQLIPEFAPVLVDAARRADIHQKKGCGAEDPGLHEIPGHPRRLIDFHESR